MQSNYWTWILTSVAVAVIFLFVRRGQGQLVGKLRDALAQAGGELELPALVTRVGLKDSFINRGQVIQAIAPLVQRGEVLEIDDPAATVKTRLELKRFRLRG